MKHEKGPGLQALACCVVIAVVATACGGINASKSVSPLDFILPGLMQNSPPAPVGPLQTNSVPMIARSAQPPVVSVTTPTAPELQGPLSLRQEVLACSLIGLRSSRRL